MQYDLSETVWRTSTYSGANSQCVTVADGLTGIVPVRDSKTAEGPSLVFRADTWTSFIANLKAGEPPTV